MSPSIRFLDNSNVQYLKSQIETGEARRTKGALQQLCKLYRNGFRIAPPLVVGVEQSIVGLLYTQAKDEKVRRWALNALARLGKEENCLEAILHVLSNHHSEPQTTAAGIAAVFRMSRKATEVLKRLSFDEQMLTLAALQHVEANRLDLSGLPLDVETAAPDLLKLALIVVGLDRAPINMLNPRYDNAEMVRALGKHDDNTVSQYSIWAITENPSLGVCNLGIDLKSIEQQPSNVRAWLFQLIAMKPDDAKKHIEYIELGCADPDEDARLGLAIGLRDTFFDGLEALVLDWFTTEADAEVSQHLLDHIVQQSNRCPNYEALALEFYEKEQANSQLRLRMSACAAKTNLYAKFKKIEFDISNDLFGGAHSVTNNNTFNINGGIQGGAVSLGGNATNTGASSMHYNPQTIEAIKSELSKAERELHAQAIDPQVKAQALEVVEAAKADPSPDNVTKALDALGKVESIASKAAGAGTAVAGIIDTIGKLLG